MSDRYLLDTNVVSEPLKPHPNPRVLERLRLHSGEISIGSPVWHELWFGARRLPPSRRRQSVESYLTSVLEPEVPIIAYDSAAADWHAAERARLSAIGKTPSFVDGQIAAIAVVNGLILVTANVADFAGFSGVTVVDWRG